MSTYSPDGVTNDGDIIDLKTILDYSKGVKGNKGRHRVVGNSEAGRRLISQNSIVDYGPKQNSKEVEDWNAQIERRKQEKKNAKQAA